MNTVTFSCFVFAVLVACVNTKQYHGYWELSVTPHTKEHVVLLNDLQRNNSELTFIGKPSQGRSTGVIVPPDQKDQILDTLKKAGIAVTVQSTDLQAEIDAEKKEMLEKKSQRQETHDKRSDNFRMHHDVYYNLDEVNEIMGHFQSAFPTVAKRKRMNHVTEEYGLPVYYMELGANDNKPVIIIEGLAHAREWIATASLLYVIHQMLEGYLDSMPSEMEALDSFTWIIIPVLNPDGYKYTWETDRLWRKNRKAYPEKDCVGVDLNRNFDAHFGEIGVSNNCSWDIYCGKNAFSESETQNVAELFRELKTRVVAYVAIHAYGQYVLYPWSYAYPDDDNVPPNHADLVIMGNMMKEVLEVQGKEYTIGTVYDHFGYPVSGSSMDWALMEQPGIYSYALELSPVFTNTSGFGEFLINTTEIEPMGMELLESLLVLAQNIPPEMRNP